MHVNVYAEDIHSHLPVKIHTKARDGVTYYGVELTLAGRENKLTIWAKSKEKLTSLFHGLDVLVDIGATDAVLHVAIEETLNFECSKANEEAKVPHGHC